MRIQTGEDQSNKYKNTWQVILYRMRERKITPAELSRRTGYTRGYIERGINGESVEISVDFLRRCVGAMIINPVSGRTSDYEKAISTFSYDDCVELLKPPPAMPPRQGNFWDWD